MKQRHPAASLRVPSAQVGGMRRIAPGGAAPLSRVPSKPTQGGAEPRAPTPHLARRHITKATKLAPSAHARTSRATPRRSGASAPSSPTTTSATIGQAVAALWDDLSFAANQPGSYQRMGGF